MIADLLGVPEADHEMFRAELAAKRPGRAVGSTGDDAMTHNPLEFLYAAVHRRTSRTGAATRATTC